MKGAIAGIIFGAMISIAILMHDRRQDMDAKEFAAYATANHCFIFEYDQRPDGRVEKKWSCENEGNNQQDDSQ